MALYTVTVRTFNRGVSEHVREVNSPRNTDRDFVSRASAIETARTLRTRGLVALVCTPHDGSVVFDNRTDR